MKKKIFSTSIFSCFSRRLYVIIVNTLDFSIFHSFNIMTYMYVAEACDATRLGRVRSAALPQEYLLHQMVENITNKQFNWNSSIQACEWSGVDCRDSLSVSSIHWYRFGIRGTLAYEKLPSTVLEVNVNENFLVGRLSLEFFPAQVTLGRFSRNQYIENFDFTVLPAGMVRLVLTCNLLSGNPDFTQLPSSLEFIFAVKNRFHGCIDLSQLPPSLGLLSLRDNLLTGIVDLRDLRSKIRIDLVENCFKGFIPKEGVPGVKIKPQKNM